MNILFPMGGRGSRLGYYSSNPKPLIKILGKTILEWSVQSLNLDGNYIFCINKKHDEICETDKSCDSENSIESGSYNDQDNGDNTQKINFVNTMDEDVVHSSNDMGEVS